MLVKQSLVKSVADFDQMAVVFESLFAVCIQCRAVHHRWEKDQDDNFAVLYCTMSTYDMIASLCVKLGLYLHAALRSFPYLGSYVLEFVNNQIQSVGETEGDTFPHSFAPPLSLRLILTAFENFEYPWDVQASTLLLFWLLNGFSVLFRVK